jgi:acyl-CoA hydrolase
MGASHASRRSRAPGAGVTTSRAHIHYVVTEYGVASLHGRDLSERTRALINIAAPQFREGWSVLLMRCICWCEDSI